MPSILKRAITGLIAGTPLGLILYAACALTNQAAAVIVIDPLIGLALGVTTSLGLQFVEDLKEKDES